jgi:hypothetical protein
MQARVRVVVSAILAALFLGLNPSTPSVAQDAAAPVDPPGRVARISVIQGDVSLEPAGAENFAQAELNYPLTLGDRVYVDLQGLAELETAAVTVRMANGADVTLTSLTDQVAQFGLAQGSIRVATRNLTAPDGSAGVVEIDTPNGTILVQAAGDIRVDSYPQNNTTVVTVNSGQAEVTGGNLNQMLGPQESVQLSGTNPVSAQYVGLLPPDALDQFDQAREGMYQSTVASASQYVSPDMIGAEDLEGNGTWSSDANYGAVWYPTTVAVGWAPYQNGRWVFIAPWGWTWVAAEPWGFAPFHYGRWCQFGGRWGWIPGPPPGIYGRPVRPVYSPALVAFVGGGPSLGVTAWFPLGPGEPFVPWYRSSAGYLNRVNVTNIYSRNAAQVRSNYMNRTANIYIGNTTPVTYANRGAALTAVNQNDFERGRRVDRAQLVRLDPNARQQLSQAPVVARPLANAPVAAAATMAPARVVPPNQGRPQLPTRGNVDRGNNMPGGSNRPSPGTAPTQPAPGVTRPMPPAAAPNAPRPRASQPIPADGAPSQRQQNQRQAQPAPIQPVQPGERLPDQRQFQPEQRQPDQRLVQPTPMQPQQRQPEQRPVQPAPVQPVPPQRQVQPQLRPQEVQPAPRPQFVPLPPPAPRPSPPPAPRPSPPPPPPQPKPAEPAKATNPTPK